jgi:hypothetical protein
MENLKHRPVSSLASGNDTITLGNVDYLRQWSVAASANTRTITVTVDWTNRGPHTVGMTTLRGE